MDNLELKSLIRDEMQNSCVLSLKLISYLKTAFLQQNDLWQQYLEWRDKLISESLKTDAEEQNT